MLHAGGHLVVACQVALIAADHCTCDLRTEIGIFAGTFGHTAPAGIAGDVDHGAESPVDAPGSSLSGCNLRRPFDGIHIPRARETEGDGEYGLIAVNHIHAAKQRNAQTGLLHSGLLQGVEFLGTLDVECAADLA